MGNEKKAPGSFLCDWLSYQSFWGGALSKELRGCSGHFQSYRPCLTLSSLSQFSKILLFLHLFCFPFEDLLPSILSPFPFSLLMLVGHSSHSSGLGHGWGTWAELEDSPTFLCSFSAPLLAPSIGLGPAGFLVHLPHVGTILCARPRLVVHLLGQVRGVEVGNRALMERGSCLSPLF